ncbi:TRAP transporter permease [Gemmobacter nectariphilus]|uniref:TRAP transporter permease n=1 Tax=Gemmobacter nectariphilus TaxID=220343 RepID=UPI000408A48A|nr:TRAP transporter fused permease subunit [Gemmobacter nectariphilus]
MTDHGLRGRVTRTTLAGLAIVVPLIAIAGVLGVPQKLGLMIFPQQLAALMLCASLAVCFLRGSLSPTARFWQLDLGLAALSLALGLHVFLRFQILSERSHQYPTEALILGCVVIGLMMEGLRRVIGYTLVVIFGLLLLYAVAGHYVPGALQGRPQPLGDVVRFLGTDSSATWGQSLQIAAFVVVLFVLFGAFLIATGGSEFFSNLAGRISGKGPGGAAKVAVTASCLTGMISGSAVSNVMTTGVVTIPVMKRAGFSATNASAIEAVASTGGQLMPPLMGAAAFLMAEILRVPYRDIIVAAALPALLYFVSIYVQIDFMARRDNMASMEATRRQPFLEILAEGWISVLAIVALMLGIFAFNHSAEVAAVYATGVTVVLALGAYLLRLRHGGMSPRQILKALVDAGVSTSEVLLITAAAGMIIGLMTLTGLGFTLSYYLMTFGSESLFALLLLSAGIALLLGLGLPTTGVYLLLATLTAPALVELGVPPIPAHMFLLYYGMLSMITPPIALAAFAAASIGGANQHKTGIAAFRFGWLSYFLPFFFIYKPGLLLETTWPQAVYVFVSTIVSLSLIAAAFLGHGHRKLGWRARAVWLALGVAIMFPLDRLLFSALDYSVAMLGLAVLLQHILMRDGRFLTLRAARE